MVSLCRDVASNASISRFSKFWMTHNIIRLLTSVERNYVKNDLLATEGLQMNVIEVIYSSRAIS